jgi:hypothetical protein
MNSKLKKFLLRWIIPLKRLAKGHFFLNPIVVRHCLSSGNVDFLINRLYPLLVKTKDISGCVVEFGVGAGRSALMLESLMHMMGDLRVFYLFDSFSGFPLPSSEDLTGNQKAKKGDYNMISPHDLIQILSQSIGVHYDKYFAQNSHRIRIVSGYFEDTLTPSIVSELKEQDGIRFLHLDVDLYHSYMHCLHQCWDLVNPGGVILFDEYHDSSLEKYPGGKLAIDEFLVSKGLNPSQVIRYDNTQSIVKRAYMIKE